MPERDDLDRLLDVALTSYADPGPNSGLERRVLARISARFPRRRRQLIWAMSAVAFVSILLLFVSNGLRHIGPHQGPETGSFIAPPPPSASGKFNISPRVVVRSGMHPRRVARRALPKQSTIPKLDVFPSPAPLSKQEEALVGLLAETPAPQRQHLAVWLQPAKPIHIAAISIPSINPPEEGKEQ